ncbi:hypothetical protein BDY19DRAFT_910161 [Irpex rosettiformis]|uniref:Uncharacterized protein n=1 Tax=Irpex rosettiformis TaxID=378272 RepID=A0ACB8TPW7_9APHY|nr:hypothetical protein BDY19DRAFT_910161 [Irpex rosettiformis]
MDSLPAIVIDIPRNCEFALATLGIYDWLLTINQEYRQIWRRKLSWISALFVVNRYVTLMTSFVMFVKNIPVIAPDSRKCVNLVLIQIVADALLSICAACFFAVQTYALFDRPTIILFIVSALGLATPIISLTVWSKAAEINLSANLLGERCSSLTALESGRYDNWLIIARACATAANLVVFGLIVWRTTQTIRLIGGKRSLSKLLVKQGALHFVWIAAPNIVAICLGRIPVLGANIPLHADSSTSILISRFIITLRRRYSDSLDDDDDDGSSANEGKTRTTVVFRTPREDSECVYSVL